MTGSRLGRGRGGRLALYGGCLVVVVLLVFLYRAATTEMTRLRDLHVQCAHQQEALAAQLQVIFEYKVRLEKSLAEEKSANTMAKQELQQRATREKSLRDKDGIEALQRYNSLQQSHKLLQSEHQDLTEECNKRQKLALEESNRLEATLQDLRSQIHSKNKDYEEKEKTIERLKTKYFVLDTEKSKIENKYNDLIRNNSNRDSTIDHLSKEIFQLQTELEQMKSSCKVTSSDPNLMNPRAHQQDVKPSLASKSSSRPQTSSTTSLSKLGIESSTASTKKLSSTSVDKSQSGSIAIAPMKAVSRLKLPMGVVPIPKMLNERMENNDHKNIAETKNSDNNKNPLMENHNNDNNDQSKSKVQRIQDNLQREVQPIEEEHVGDHILNSFNKKDNAAWNLRVKPGFQEIGEPNRDDKLSDFDERRPQDVEEQDDDYREPQLGEEEPDEDDQIEDDQIK